MENTKSPLDFQDKVHVGDTSFNGAVRGIHYDTNLSKAYFSHENIQIIQNAIRKGIYDKSNGQYTIAEQNTDTLNIIMRSIFLQNSCNLETNITKQIISLNNLVINYSINQINGEVGGYMKYKNDISTLAMPMNRPIYANKTTNTLELKPWF